MGAGVDYLQRDPKTGRLSFRRALPPELRPYIPGRNGIGPRELKKSLKASVLTAEAMAAYRAASDEYDLIVRRAKQLADGTYHAINRELISYLSNQYEAAELEWDERLRRAIPGSEVADIRRYQPRADIEDDYIESRKLLDRYDSKGLEQLWGTWAETFARTHGYIVRPEGQPFADLCWAMAEAACKLWLNIERRLDGELTDTPKAPSAPRATSRAASEDSFEDIALGILGSLAEPVTATTQQASKTALRFLREGLGALTPCEIQKAQVTSWRELLSQRPAKLPPEERHLALPTLIERYKGRVEVVRMSPKTQFTHVSSLAAIWNKAQDRGLIDADLPNPFKFKGSKPPPTSEMPQLTVDEMARIFDLPVFTSGDRPAGGRGEACYWIPLLLLWTGARPEEIAQLLVADVRKDPPTGRWLLRITDQEPHPFKGRRTLKTSKSGTGRREFPIPQALLDLNFMDYVESLRASKAVALFPELRTKGARNELFAAFGGWWSGYLTAQKVELKGQNRRPSREFRHAWSTAARASGIAREAMEYIQGHGVAAHTANERYGTKDAHGLQIDKLAFSGLDLTRVRPWVARGAAGSP